MHTRPFLLAAALGAAAAAQHPLDDEAAGLRVLLPSADWKLQDQSGGGAIVHIYSPKKPPVPRVTLMRFPAAFLADGLATRRTQLAAIPGFDLVRFEPGEIAGAAGNVFEYRCYGVRTVERGRRAGDAWVVVQVAADDADWKDAAKAAAYERVFATASLLAAPAPRALRVDRKTPEQVRAARAAHEPEPQPFNIVSHDVALVLEPERGSLAVTDEFVVEGRGEGTQQLELRCTHVHVDEVTAGGAKLAFESAGGKLTVPLPERLAAGAQLRLRFAAHAESLRATVEQDLVAEIAVLGQVDPISSFSSHVHWYPSDRENSASMRMSISVPAGYTAVTGGELLGEDEQEGRRVFRYEAAARTPRGLPFGFAAARYERLSAATESGLQLDVYHPPGKEKQARQRLDVGLAAGTLFEDLMGPLPWRRVAFCCVKPRDKETGVALPGLVLASEGFFKDAADARLDASSLSEPKGLGLLLIADELSHQWNFHAVPLPNELAEGISTFTNLLVIEAKSGAAEYRRGVEFCAQVYLGAAGAEQDVALADPALYESKVYRAVAFCKVPAVLDLLRVRLGDQRFRAAWRHAFTQLRGKRTGYDELQQALGDAAETDLRAFFDQWFFQAGHPRADVTWRGREEPGGARVLELEVAQRQPGGLFDFALTVEADCGAAGKVQLAPLAVRERTATLRRPVPGPVRAVTVRAEADSPLIRVTVQAGR
ncbi:MAG TPA: M1 family aminopeptidase [Planctomycetota bacterium]